MIETDIKNFVVPTSSYIPEIASRLYIGTLPDVVTYPAVAMFSISRVEMPEALVFNERVQFSCYADNLSSATIVMDAVKDRLKGFYGVTSTVSTYTILSAYPESVTYLYDSEIQKHIKILDVMIMYRR